MRLLVTGGCGFLGSHFVRAWLRDNPDAIVVNVDCLTYAGSAGNLVEAADNPHYRHQRIDTADAAAMDTLWTKPYDLVVHFAAETHVDRSLEDAGRFVKTNVLGTQTLLAAACRHGQRLGLSPPVIVISSDEVYGPTPRGTTFGVDEPLRPTSPYAASKAAADWMARSYGRSFGLDVTIVRSVNVYGPRQHPEKMIPLFTTRALAGKPLPLYGEGHHQRCWLYIDDFVAGLTAIARDPRRRAASRVWHLGSPDEIDNAALAAMLCDQCGADRSLITTVPDRPGHDDRYALDYSHTTSAFGWQPTVQLHEGLKRTVEWIRAHEEWCRRRTGWTPTFLREN